MSKDPETESHPGPLDGFGIEPFQPDTSRPERDESQPSEPVPELEHADESPSVGACPACDAGDESPSVAACPSCDQGDESTFSLQPEIDAIRQQMSWLQARIAETDSIEDRIMLGRAYEKSGYCLARLLQTQKFVHGDEQTEFRRTINEVLIELNAEWGRT